MPVFDATVAARVKSAGALARKTNTDEFAMGSSTENSAWGPSRNPWDHACREAPAAALPRRSPPAVPWARLRHGRLHQAARALRERQSPPDVYGSVSRYGVVAFASSLDQVVTLAATASDAWRSCTRSSRA